LKPAQVSALRRLRLGAHRLAWAPAKQRTSAALAAGKQPLNSPWRFTAAAAALTTAAAHVSVSEDNIEASPYLGVLFILVSCCCLVLATRLIRRDTRHTWRAATGLCALALVALLWNGRLAVLRVSDDVGPWTEPLAIVAACAEATVVLLGLLALGRRTVRALLVHRALPMVMGAMFLCVGLAATALAAAKHV
jgi:hypothetical protein